MKFKSIFIILIAFICLSFGLPKGIQKKVDKEIEEVFEIENFQFNAKAFDSKITQNLPSTFGPDNFFEIKNSSQLLGYAYISKAPSKTDEFDYLIILDKQLTVLKAKVLVYREDYGGEIGSKRWLKQFIGKSQNDELKYRDNIVAISGATISVRSMTTAVNDLLKSLKILHSKQLL
ncbi:Na+-translocating ferredoxin:NAD+ oxidoreductase RnfG subunit [Flavobacteriaceae bacterium MAR_2010_72]|nr:Na+-translocating ferredoxin:NAD+ oxidoreductase RnfG subunit [Flavobacteriaceae bacterium MAR_2010_72]TVZ60089.1 Na+-translocating ferredoxin:NAD+ oxidoreductase RnfG subunit [Flavobacteriaceae bacterium MAR_2010_105]